MDAVISVAAIAVTNLMLVTYAYGKLVQRVDSATERLDRIERTLNGRLR